MTPQDVIEANYALDMQIEAEKKAANQEQKPILAQEEDNE